MTQEEQEYQEHYSPDGEYLEYLMEHPELQEEIEKRKKIDIVNSEEIS